MKKLFQRILNRWRVREYKKSIERLELQVRLFEIPYELALTAILHYKIKIQEIEAGRS